MVDNFAVFILTHGRPDHVITYKTLIRQGYTGPVYFIIDNEDDTAQRYYELYGDKVIMFDKLAVYNKIDSGDNFPQRGSILYARNVSFEIAEKLGVEYFLELDDDYKSFVYKFTSDYKYNERPVKNLDKVFSFMLDYYKSIGAITIAFGQNGDLLGGKNSSIMGSVRTKRKAMNTFFCSTKRPFGFFGKFNEDVNTYVRLGMMGKLLLSVFSVTIIQCMTQGTEGGITELYKEFGTYCKSFMTVMYAPSCVKVSEVGYLHRRIHHKVHWEHAVPKILEPRYKKGSVRG